MNWQSNKPKTSNYFDQTCLSGTDFNTSNLQKQICFDRKDSPISNKFSSLSEWGNRASLIQRKVNSGFRHMHDSYHLGAGTVSCSGSSAVHNYSFCLKCFLIIQSMICHQNKDKTRKPFSNVSNRKSHLITDEVALTSVTIHFHSGCRKATRPIWKIISQAEFYNLIEPATMAVWLRSSAVSLPGLTRTATRS